MHRIIRLKHQFAHIIIHVVAGLLIRKCIAIVASLFTLVILFTSLVLTMPARVYADILSPAALLVPATPDPLQVRRDILANPDLQHRDTAPQLPRINTPDLPAINLPFLPYLLLGIGGLLLIVLLILVAPFFIRYFASRAKLRDRTKGARKDGLDVATSGEAIVRAQEASDLQDFRLALRLLYLASLLKLDEIGALRYDRALTNREYVREVALKPPLATALRPVVETFDDVWYGYRPITRAGYDAFEINVKTLMAEAEGLEKRD